MRNRLGALVVMAGLLTSGLGLPLQAQAGEAPTGAVVQGTAAFTLNLYRRLQARQPGNLFFSPYSVSLALSMAYAGARGETAAQMARVLGFSLPPEQSLAALGDLSRLLAREGNEAGQTLNVANAAWLNNRLQVRPEYLKLIKSRLHSEVRPLDFCQGPRAEKTVNEWVARQTRDHIRDLIPGNTFNCDTRLVLTNAIYFLGEWAKKFAPDQTRPEPFWLTPQQQVETPFMHRRGEYSYQEAGDWQVLELPYRENKLAMVVLLPKDRGGLAAQEASLDTGTLEKLLTGLRPRQVEVSLPRFEMKTRTELSDVLKGAGMPAAFAPGADFTGIAPREPLFISLVLHQAWVKVEEKGTEAAAATAVVITKAMAPGKREEVVAFKADHPFLFLIRARPTGLIVFWGRLADPKAG